MSGFLGSGWAFPIRLAGDGTILRSPEPDGAVDDAIRMILSTTPGERVMRPDYGCTISEYVFGLVDSGTTGQISQAVREALAEWEPRIDVVDVTTTQDPQDPRRLSVAITYQIRSSNSRVNLVYPFYLE
ncbi:GPW/gp25 family protein [Dactylosporangium sp. NPDC051485]|uniref:GPW/gp25 family protein n=1 Tax=Dactylosporangium sp. NPDC051485 TaxID=3154846 RepID=UPI00341501DB